VHDVTVIRIDVVPDFDRNGQIDEDDRAQKDVTNPFRLWINILLRQQNSAVKAVYSDLSRGNAAYLTHTNELYGTAFDKPAHEAPTFTVTNGGVTLPVVFTNKMAADASKGVLLLEGVKESTTPLVLELKLNGQLVTQAHLPMAIDGVEKMYRWHNFRENPSSSMADRLFDPPHRPDVLCTNNVDVFMVHGFNVEDDEARGWGAEFFKRLYQEGMNARFHAVTWKGDQGTSLSYETNVHNALMTASNLATRVNGVKATNNSEVVVMAHSLGCMLTAAAITDWGMNADKFFALNGAVPVEAFDPALVDEGTNALNRLLHPDWRGYDPKTWSACWYKLFTDPVVFPDDARATLTWRGRLQSSAGVLYNFWSAGDEVLEIAPNSDIDATSGIDWEWELDWAPLTINARQFAWHKQALFKGRGPIHGTIWAGWGFHKMADNTRFYTLDAANALDDASLRSIPVFKHNPPEMFSSTISTNMHNNLLARGIPELSFPVGVFEIPGKDNENMQTLQRTDGLWPSRGIDFNNGQSPDRWLHSDSMNVAHFYTHRLFKRFIEVGSMK
jgi:hypothetical protein